MQALEPVLVTFIVIFCAAFSVWRLLSLRLRLRVLDALPGTPGGAVHVWKARLRSKLLQQISPGCTTCSERHAPLSAAAPDANRKSVAPHR